MSSIQTLESKIQRIRQQVKPAQEPPVYRCFWGDEQIPLAPGERLIITVWSSKAVTTEQSDD